MGWDEQNVIKSKSLLDELLFRIQKKHIPASLKY
jgi:hypothetical protein